MINAERVYDLENFDDLKTFSFRAIGLNARAAIEAGVTFAGLVFSMSETAQINWSNLPNLPESAFPLTLNTKDDSQAYKLAYSDRLNFWGAAMQHKHSAIQAANALKAQVRECETVTEIRALLHTI